MKSFSWDELHMNTLEISGNSQNLLFITTLSLVYFKFQKKCTKIYYSTRRVKQNLQQEFVYPPPWCAVVKLPHDFWLCGTVATLNRSIKTNWKYDVDLVGIIQQNKPPGGSTQHLGDVQACIYIDVLPYISFFSSASFLPLGCWHHAVRISLLNK